MNDYNEIVKKVMNEHAKIRDIADYLQSEKREHEKEIDIIVGVINKLGNMVLEVARQGCDSYWKQEYMDLMQKIANDERL